jgi:hypothetical protein
MTLLAPNGNAATTDSRHLPFDASRSPVATPRHRRGPSEQILGPRDVEVLRWLAEQYAARVDHLQGILGCGERQTQRVIARLRARDLVHCERLSTHEPRWLLPTTFGLRLSLTGFRPWHPHLALLAHCGAVNDVRLHIERRSPEAVWTSERQLGRKYGLKGHLPDGVVLLEGKTVAIEVELTPKAKPRTARIIDGLCAGHDSVLYFASPEARESLLKLAANNRWPSLGIRALPGESGAQA